MKHILRENLYVFTILFFISSSLFSQSNSNINSRQEIINLKDTLNILQNQIEKLDSKIDENSAKDQINEKILSAKQDIILDIAGKIIEWSAMLFGVLVLILIIAGWIATKRFSQIDTTAKEMSKLLEEMKVEFSKMSVLKKEMENERKYLFELVYQMNRGDFAIFNGDIPTIINAANNILKIKPENDRAYFMLGYAYSADGKYEEAINNLILAIKYNRNNADAYYNLGRTYRRSGDFDKAIKYLKISLNKDHKLDSAAKNIGHVYKRKGEFEKASEWYYKALKIKPNDEVALINLAMLAYRTKDVRKAEDLYNKAKLEIEKSIKKGKIRYWNFYHLGEIALFVNDIKKAEEYFNKAFSMNLANETLQSIKFDLTFLKECPNPPKEIDRFIELISEKLN